MKRLSAIFASAAAVCIIAAGWIFSATGTFLSKSDAHRLEQIPVLKGGRIMPLSSAASDTLRIISGKSSVKIDGKKTGAAEWLLYINAFPQKAVKEPFFKTDNKDLRDMLGVKGRYYSFGDIEAKLDPVTKEARNEDLLGKACLQALKNLEIYAIAENSLALKSEGVPPAQTFENWRGLLRAAESEAAAAKEQKREPDRKSLSLAFTKLSFLRELERRENNYKNYNIYAVRESGQWLTPVQVMLNPKIKSENFEYFSKLGNLAHSLEQGGANIAETLDEVLKSNPPSMRVKLENAFNRLDIFFRGAILYVLSFMFFLFAPLFKTRRDALFNAAATFLLFAVSCHMFGILGRMYIQMRPPVTNMYSSVIFTGAVAALIALLASIKSRKLIFGLSGAPLGFLSIILAVNLPYSGDTMGMMRAVLNSNFWLAAHIIPMMLGYCGVFLAGLIASLKLLQNAFSLGRLTQNEIAETVDSVYKISCFAMGFAFLGTMLGGIWADFSWGRFWGWDPKENGALMVVIWCALTVHAKIMRIFGDRMILALACVGSMVAAWAWFGVNMMGVGLHSYGFMDSGMKWLMAFAIAQSVIALLAFVPVKKS